jgi:hypothetical protein
MHEGTANKERQEGKFERSGCCGMENSSWEGREGRGPGGKEGNAGADTNVDEGEEEENDGERKTGERRREPEKREDKRKAEGTREGVERKQAGKARGQAGGGEVTTTTAAACENERKRGRATGQETGRSAHHAKNGGRECTR